MLDHFLAPRSSNLLIYYYVTGNFILKRCLWIAITYLLSGPPTGGNTRDKVTGPPSLGGPQGAPKGFRRGPMGPRRGSCGDLFLALI